MWPQPWDCREGALSPVSSPVNLELKLCLFSKASAIVSASLCGGARSPCPTRRQGRRRPRLRDRPCPPRSRGSRLGALHGSAAHRLLLKPSKKPLGPSVTSPYRETRSFPKTRIWDSKSEQAQGGGMDWEFGLSRCQVVYIGWINNKVLPYSTGNYIRYPGTNHDAKRV